MIKSFDYQSTTKPPRAGWHLDMTRLLLFQKVVRLPQFCLQLALYRHSPTSGRQNTVKKDPQPLLGQKEFVPLRIMAFSPFMAHHNISLRFRAGGQRVKNFRFSRICMSACDFFLSACCGLNFDATDLPNSQFEPLYPKLFRGTPEVDLVSTVWPPDLPKVR